MLHNDKDNFEQVILKVSSETGIEPAIIEKDYYVTLFLKRLVVFNKIIEIIQRGASRAGAWNGCF